jgi:hypothetical protein
MKLFFTFIQDTKTHFVYQNDEAVSAVEFKLINTDTEVGGGANANTNVVLYLHGDSNGGRGTDRWISYTYRKARSRWQNPRRRSQSTNRPCLRLRLRAGLRPQAS